MELFFDEKWFKKFFLLKMETGTGKTYTYLKTIFWNI